MEICAIHVAESISFFQSDHFVQVFLNLIEFLDFPLHCFGDCFLYQKTEVLDFYMKWIEQGSLKSGMH